MDPAYPQERLSFMLEDTQAPVLLTLEHLRAGLPAHAATVVCLDSDWDTIAAESAENPGQLRHGRKSRLHHLYFGFDWKTQGSPRHPL